MEERTGKPCSYLLMGIVFYSPGLVTTIPIDSNFFGYEFTNPSDVDRHIKKGGI